MKCEAVALRTGARCKNDAIADTGACEHEAHKRQVAERRALVDGITGGATADELSEAAIAPTWDSLETQQQRETPAVEVKSDTSRRTADPELAAILAELPAAPDSTAEDIAETTSAGSVVRDLGELEHQARKILPDADDLLDDELEPAEVDAAAAARSEEQDAARVQLRRDVTSIGGQWTPARVEFYLRVLINPRFAKSGKDPLDDAELQEGAELGARMLNDLLGARPENPYLAFAAWGATVTLTRYLEEVLSWIGNQVRRVRGKSSAAAPRVEEAAPAAAARPSGGVDIGFGGLH